MGVAGSVFMGSFQSQGEVPVYLINIMSTPAVWLQTHNSPQNATSIFFGCIFLLSSFLINLSLANTISLSLARLL